MSDKTYETKVYMKQGGDELVVANGGKITLESGGEIALEAGGLLPLLSKFRKSVEDTYTLLESQSGLVYLAMKTSATQVISLPAPTTPGLVFSFICGHADGEINIDPGAATYKITGVGIAVAATKDLKNTAASNAVGDSVTLVSDGVDGWWILSIQGTWAST